MDRTNKVIILLGPTGVGKTGLSILLAGKLGTEIISADSMQIYRHMDIGTAKPSKEQLLSVRHHMIDIAEPSETYSAGRFIEDVRPVIEGLHARNKIPLVVGGTGLYIKAMTRGLFKGPSADWPLREKLLVLEKENKGFLYDYLRELDAEISEKISPNDTRRLIRALEVCFITRRKMIEMQDKLTEPLPYEYIKIGITRNRKELYRIIEERTEQMLAAGLMDEVKKVLSMNPGMVPMQAIGYKEIAMFLNREISYEEAVTLIKRNSRRYAKRQFTWFKKENNIHWLDITGVYDSREVLGRVNSLLSTFI